ncbi:hypothetical protein LTSEBAI_5134 [Salmonella enterica subsp. enterica serovar Baildon str. R6-199]|nr:hypothetical protein LTSEBAI_5134 [Salmonella enterica subsp. enterica serovar Baildon str. R6-199]
MPFRLPAVLEMLTYFVYAPLSAFCALAVDGAPLSARWR